MAKRRYIIKKYVLADTITDALRLEKKAKIDDVTVDFDWQEDEKKKPLGFHDK